VLGLAGEASIAGLRTCAVMLDRASCPATPCHRCLGFGRGAGAYRGGWFRCPSCLIRAADRRRIMLTTEATDIAGRLVSLASSAVAESSASTYESARKLFTRFCSEAPLACSSATLTVFPSSAIGVRTAWALRKVRANSPPTVSWEIDSERAYIPACMLMSM
jgi:hypothetical protein